MNNPQLPPVDAPVGEIARHIAELMRLHPNVYSAVTNAVRSLHPLDLHTLQFLRAKFKESNMRHQHPKGPDFEQGENYAFARIDEVLANAIEQAGGTEVRPEYTETEQNCRGCMGPCGRCEEPDLQEPKPEIPWDKLEDWAMWAAMDSDKHWWRYEFEPERNERDRDWWSCTGKKKLIQPHLIPFTAPDWRTSLRQRPKNND